jgi:hypothetical protein
MSQLAHIQPTLGSTSFEKRPAAPTVLILRATDAGWALVTQDGEVVFEAEGLEGRQECLAFARDRGVLALIS